MAFLHTQSCECLKTELLLFDVPPTQTTVESSHWVQYKPISSLTDDSPIEFVCPGTSDEYMDLTHTMLSLRVTIKLNIDPKELSDSAKEGINFKGPVNNFMHSLFNQVDVFLNHKPVSQPNNAYAYRSYIETLLNYSPAAKESHLGTVLWHADTAGKMDDLKDENDGLVARRAAFFNDSVDLIGHLHCDVFSQDRLLLNGVELGVRLVRSSDKFCLMDSTNHYAVHIDEANLIIRRVKISPGVLLAHAKALSKTTAKYPLTRVEVKALTMHKDSHGEVLDNIILGQLPQRVIICFVNNKAYNGDRLLNPFNFEHFNLDFLCLYVNGVQVPSRPLQPNFSSNLYVDAYQTLFSGTGIHYLNEGNQITRAMYPKGYCLFAFDLTADLSANNLSHWNLIKHGTVRLEVKFSVALKKTINAIVYSEFENLLEIDASRQVMVDFNG